MNYHNVYDLINLPDEIRVTTTKGDTQTYKADRVTLIRNTTLKEDLAYLTEPLTKYGSMSYGYGDAYYARSLEEKWGAKIDELKRRIE